MLVTKSNVNHWWSLMDKLYWVHSIYKVLGIEEKCEAHRQERPSNVIEK
jgi:hypothetical protein